MVAVLGEQIVNVADNAKRAMKRAITNSADEPILTFADLTIEGAYCDGAIREVRVPNDVSNMNITVSDHQWGEGVVVSALDQGLAMKAGVLVGDVIVAVNGIDVNSHEHAIAALKYTDGCTDIILSLKGTRRKVVIDKLEGYLDCTLSNKPDGPGVECTAAGMNGMLYREGVQAGDTIVSINGCLVTDHKQGIAIMDSSDRFIELVIAEPRPFDEGSSTSGSSCD